MLALILFLFITMNQLPAHLDIFDMFWLQFEVFKVSLKSEVMVQLKFGKQNHMSQEKQL